MPNRLAKEKSPYLLQHALNPVDWYPWGEEAFAKAQGEDKPIFLSIGYSTCHWCHVMEHESFQREEIAALLNTRFVPIKVDREERPDVDRIYMTALQAMGQNGGWPLTMFLTPDLSPFYGGTYFPPEPRHGRAGLPGILRKIDELWHADRPNVEGSAKSIAAYLHDLAGPRGGNGLPDATLLDRCFEQLFATFDAQYGGFGTGAKFPRPATLEFLLRYHVRSGRMEPLQMVNRTLDAMASGALRDHIGGGFHRYTVDAAWRVPHFEKMLYDQAQLISVYLNAYLVTGNPRYAEVVRDTLGYVLRDLRSEEGGFCSAEDADSPKPDDPADTGEGAYYLWSQEETVRLLGAEAGARFALRYGIEAGGNAAVDPQQEFTGKNILFLAEELSELSKAYRMSSGELEEDLTRSRATLFRARSGRPRPSKDDKILTAWNGLLMGAMARAGWVLEDRTYLDAARQAARFVLSTLRDAQSGRLLRRYREGEARFDGHLQDYAFVIYGLLDLFEVTGEGEWLEPAINLAQEMIGLFEDISAGGFFESTGEDTSLLARLKESYDGAEPSGNSVAALDLLRLAALTGDDMWHKQAERTIVAFTPVLVSQPVVMPCMISALDWLLGPSKEIVLVGREEDPGTIALADELRSRYLPTAVIIRAQGSSDNWLQNTFAASMAQSVKGPAAYVCENFTCNLPVTGGSALGALLDGISRR